MADPTITEDMIKVALYEASVEETALSREWMREALEIVAPHIRAQAEAERDAARALADRLAALLRGAAGLTGLPYSPSEIDAALAEHSAARAAPATLAAKATDAVRDECPCERLTELCDHPQCEHGGWPDETPARPAPAPDEAMREMAAEMLVSDIQSWWSNDDNNVSTPIERALTALRDAEARGEARELERCARIAKNAAAMNPGAEFSLRLATKRVAEEIEAAIREGRS